MAAIYEGASYFVKEDSRESEGYGYTADYLAERPFIEAKFDRVLTHLERYVEPGRLLDVGAGPGYLVSVAQRRGWDAVGLDLNEWAVDHGRDVVGVDVRLGSLTADSFLGEQFDAVTLMDVVEHVVDVDAILAEVSRLLRPGGALVLLTPDAGARVSRALGRRWPEVVPGEHAVLYSVSGLSAALRRHGFIASGWHTIGKQAAVSSLLADAIPAAPWLKRVQGALAGTSMGRRVVELDPRTKVCLYARRLPDGLTPPEHRVPRIPKRPERLAQVDEAILGELGSMARSTRLCQWTFDAFADHLPGARVLEVGAGIGTFTGRMLDAGVEEVLAMEPEAVCADVLDETFAGEPRVLVTRDALPHAPSLEGQEGTFDLVVCQNVLEHIGDDLGALEAMRRTLRSGGRLSLLVPASPRLFGALDDAYGHWRRYDEQGLRALLVRAGFSIEEMYSHNALGILGWWAKNRRPGARVDATSLKVYEAMVGLWRPIEERTSRRVGLSLVCTAVSP